MTSRFLGAALALLAASTALAQTDPPPAPAPAPVEIPVAAPAPPPPVLTWEVKQRFRLWDLPSFTDKDRAETETLLLGLRGAPSAGDVHQQVVAFVRARKTLHSKGYWNAETRTYKPGYIYPKTYEVSIGLTNGADYAGQTCAWTTTAGKLNLLTAPCENSVIVALPATMTNGRYGAAPAEVTVVTPGGATAKQTVRVRDRLIVSFGDSFASGEGNPDVPSNLAALQGGWGANATAAYKQVWVGRDSMRGVKDPGWVDTGCHRSSFNQHLVAALKYAADRPQEAVTFLSYACSGAATFNGLLTPQVEPPGYKDNEHVKQQDLSQIEMAVRDLCPTDDTGASTARKISDRTFQKYRKPPLPWDKPYVEVKARAYNCGGLPTRGVDAILLSGGGNDAGFSAVIMGVLLPKAVPDPAGQIFLSVLRAQTDIVSSAPVASGIIKAHIRPDMMTLAKRLTEFAPSAPVIMGGYPSPVQDANGFCGPTHQSFGDARLHPANARLAAINALPPPKIFKPQYWSAIIDQDDGGDVEGSVVSGLNYKLRTTAKDTKWRFVTDGADKLKTHGWCASDPKSDDANLPDYDSGALDWTPWRPYAWDPYKSRARFFRTPNDAALTQMPENPRSWDWADLAVDEHFRALMAAFAGSFHPTFEGHVVMGLSLAGALQQDLSTQD